MKKRARLLLSQRKPATFSIDGVIYVVRDERVILDADLAKTYGVATEIFNQAVRRNGERFPPDFLLELTTIAADSLKRGQNVKYAPFAFTEHGALMAATILNSSEATQTNFQGRRRFAVRA